jgi:hypothetical protein
MSKCQLATLEYSESVNACINEPMPIGYLIVAMSQQSFAHRLSPTETRVQRMDRNFALGSHYLDRKQITIFATDDFVAVFQVL